MAQSSFPFENIDTTETQYSYLMRNIGEGVVTGRENELVASADGSGMTVDVDTGEALVRGHYYRSNAVETLAIAASDPSNPRVDSVILRLDPVVNSIILAVLTGTAAGSPTAPTLTQTDTGIYEILIATVEVGAGAVVVASEDVTDGRTLHYPWTGSINSSNVVTTLKTVAGTTYSTIASDSGKLLVFTSATDVTLTVDDVLSPGEQIQVYQSGAGLITFTEGTGSIQGAGATGADLTNEVQYQAVSIYCISAGTYAIIGNVTGA